MEGFDDPAFEKQSRSLVSEIVFGPERSSVLHSDVKASGAERLLRDWVASEQEFKAAGQAASEGRAGAALGWGALGLAAAIPFGGQAVRAFAKGVGVAPTAAKATKAVSNFKPAKKVVSQSDEVFLEPFVAPVPEGHVRLIHQTPVAGKEIRSSGLKIESAKGIEGPRAVYAVEPESGRGFYGAPEVYSGTTVEFSIPRSEWDQFGPNAIPRSIAPEEIIAVHEPWHFIARRLMDEDVLSDIRLGNFTEQYFDSLGEDYLRAFNYVKQLFNL
jgi:hypothetical protein